MRTILFKAHGIEDRDKNHWYQGNYWRTDDTTYCVASDYESSPNNTHHYIVFDEVTDWGLPNRKMRADINPETLCEYTGKLDHNKKRIWEHDIVRVTNTYNNPATVSWYVIRYRPQTGAFVFTDPKELMYSSLDGFHELCHIEVMGNEFDNPELLENVRSQTPEEFQAELEEEMRKRGIKND